ncbi:MAG: hypothetical protein ACYC2H_05495 [Thermoplasmatota archaeon]
MPRPQRISLALGVSLVAFYVAVQLILQATSPVLAEDLLRLFVLTMVAGREPALFAVYQTTHPVPVAWAAAMAIVDDLATLFLAAPLAWLLVDRLRRFSLLDSLLRSFEHSLAGHRAAVDRWGVLALALFLWLPGWGTGPSLSVSMGILAGIPAVRLLSALAASCVGVNLFWAISLASAAEAAPDDGAWEFLPLAVIGVLVGLGILGALRQRHRLFILEYPARASSDASHATRLAAWGFERRGPILQLDARRLEAAGGPPARQLARCHWAGELLLLPSMTPPWAGRLATLGVTGVQDLALLPESLLREAMGVEDPGAKVPIRAWLMEARAFAAEGMPPSTERRGRG